MRGALVALIAALCMLAASPSHAHRISTRSGPPPEGVSIPSLTHGQMAVIRDNLPAIRALASARLGFDLTTWRLEDYLNLQSFACLWGIVPGSITDENSPFNECAHAYLAAGRALLLQLAHEPGADHKSIDALISKIEVEMLADGASMNLCRYSDEPFNTNEIIWPHWGMVPFHPPTAMMAAAAFAALGAAVWGVWPRRTCARYARAPRRRRRYQRCGVRREIRQGKRPTPREAFLAETERRLLIGGYFAQGAFCGFPFCLFISFEAPVVAGTSVLPVPEVRVRWAGRRIAVANVAVGAAWAAVTRVGYAGSSAACGECQAWNQDKRHSGERFEFHRVSPSSGDVEKSVRAHS